MKKIDRDLFFILLSAVLFLAALLLPASLPFPVKALLFLAAYLAAGWEVLWKALRQITRAQVFSEYFLMSLASLGALYLGEFAEATAVMLFYQVGEFFQNRAVGKSRDSIRQLMEIWPETANVERGGSVLTVAPDEVEVNEIIVIRPGERVPLDSIVLEGYSTLNTAAMTGESLPRDIAPGDEVISGCINLSGVLRARVHRPLEESSVSRVIELVEEAGERKSRSERFVTRFAVIYTPIVVILAVLLVLIPVLFFQGDWQIWFTRALNFLVVSCPCALVISVPLSFFGAIGYASRSGILVKGSDYLEKLARAELFVFDKTGTLTTGVFAVSAVDIAPGTAMDTEQVLALAAAAEAQSNHPIAVSIREAANMQALPRCHVLEEIPGKGIRAESEGREILLGNFGFLRENGVEVDTSAFPAAGPGTEICLAVCRKAAARIRVSDQLRADAKPMADLLHQKEKKRLVMLSGDKKESAEAVAAEIGLDEVHAELLPQDKVARVEKLLQENSTDRASLVYVGDGINDAPVLALADVGIAMGGLGQDAAIEAADIVIMDDQPGKIVTALRIARRAVSIARQNVVFALGVKALILLLSAVGLAGMWLAVFGDVGVAILATLNAMRNLRPLR